MIPGNHLSTAFNNSSQRVLYTEFWYSGNPFAKS